MKKWWWLIPLSFILFNLSPSSTRSPIDRVERIADAIAFAEGFYKEGSRAQRNNNPGNLTASMAQSFEGYDGPFVIFTTIKDGWYALYMLIADALNGVSNYYNADMSINDFAKVYTTTEQEAWANNVARILGVPVTTPIREV